MKAISRAVPFALLFALRGPLLAQTGPLDEAAQLIQAGRFAEAKALVLPIAAREPDNARAAYLAGRALLQLNETDPATKQLERAVQKEPTSSEYQMWLGRAYGTQAQRASVLRQPGLAKKTKAAFDRAVALDPDNIDARANLIDYYIQAPGLLGGDKKKGLLEAEEIRKRNEWRGLHELARVHSAMENNTAAEQALTTIVREFPDSVGARISLSLFYQNTGKVTEAYTALEPLLQRTPVHTGALYQVGRIGAVTGKELDRAETALRDYLKLTPQPNEPSHAAAHWRIGMIMEHRRDKVAARREYEAALLLEPNHVQAKEALKKLK